MEGYQLRRVRRLKPAPLPPGYESDLTQRGVNSVGEIPFAHGLLKMRQGKPFREAYLTRSGRGLSRGLSAE